MSVPEETQSVPEETSVPKEQYWFSVVHFSGTSKWIDAVGDLHESVVWEEVRVESTQQSNPERENAAKQESKDSEENSANSNKTNDREHPSKGSSPERKRRRTQNDTGIHLEQKHSTVGEKHSAIEEKRSADEQNENEWKLRLTKPLSVGRIMELLAYEHDEVTEVCQIQLCKEVSSKSQVEKLYSHSVLTPDDMHAITSGRMMLRYLIFEESSRIELDSVRDTERLKIPESQCVRLAVNDAKAIPKAVDALENWTNIISLDLATLWNFPLRDVVFTNDPPDVFFTNELAKGCSKSQTLHHLGIDGARNYSGNTDIQDQQRRKTSKLRSSVRNVANVLKVSTSLLSLKLSSVGMRRNGAAVIGESLARNTTLRSLSLDDNEIGSEGAWIIAQALRKNTTLRGLDLDGNIIGTWGVEEIARALGVNKALLSINLARNGIGSKGEKGCARVVKAIADLLRKNKTLWELSLDENDINALQADLTEVADALKANTSLRRLSLALNPTGRMLALAIAETLKVNTTLEILDLGDCDLKPDHVATLAKALKSNVTLTFLDLKFWNTSPKDAAAIKEILRRNNQNKQREEGIKKPYSNRGTQKPHGKLKWFYPEDFC